ncbi:MAG: cobalt transporter CbiM [Candidatus Adiutricales bacterium]|jgi:cobalt/nickel transport system permease protein
MHISEGVLSGPVLISGGALTVLGTAIGLKKLDYDRIPQVALLSSVFFVTSIIHVPLGPSNVHLVLNGLLGLLLGWVAFPAVLVGLTLQAVLFQFGGLTTLGVNGLILAVPAVVVYYTLGPAARSRNRALTVIASFLSGFGAVFLSSLIMAVSLIFTDEAFWPMAKLVILAHLPVMVIEGLFVTVCVQFLKKVRPEILVVVYAAKYND